MAKLTALLVILPFVGLAYPSLSQTIVPAKDGVNTSVNSIGNRLDISGGQLSGDRANLFHSFQKFGLNANQIANFLSNPSIQNILGRVVGGDASVINGLIRVTGGNSNLFLMNPAGIIFGNNASLNVAGAFTATTANGIGFGNNFFNAIGNNNYAALVGNPNSFAFTMSQPGAIINTADLAVNSGKDINFLGGTVINSGTLSAPDGNIILAAVPGKNLVRLSQVGDVIGLEFQPNPNLGVNPWGLSILTLPQLLTGGNLERATGLRVNTNGEIILTAANLPVDSGDVVVKGINSGSSLLTASQNLTLVNSQLQTSRDMNLLAGDTVIIRDSITTPFIANAGTKLSIQGNKGIDIFALNNSASGLFSGTDMILKSAATVNGDTRYFVGSNFRIEKLDGSLGNLFSPFDPVIKSNGDVSLLSYEGASLHILAGGAVTILGDIKITGTEASGFISETFSLSDGVTNVSVNGNTKPTLDIRAGIIPASAGLPTSANITIGNVVIAVPNGEVILTNQYQPNTSLTGNIQTGNIDTRTPTGRGGNVTIDSRGSVTAGNIRTTTTAGTTAGSVIVLAQDNVTTGGIDTTSFTTANAGNVSITSRNGAITSAAIESGARATNANTGNGGRISITASKDITVTNRISSDAFITGTGVAGNGGNITVRSDTGNITATDVRAGSVIQGAGTTANAGTISIVTTGDINVGDVTSNSEIKGGNGTTRNGANITLQGNNITTADIASLSVISDGSGVGNVGKGGDIKVDATGNISARRISSTSAVAQGNSDTGGNIRVITSNGNINILGDVTSASVAFVGNAKNAGNINFNTTNGNINIGRGILAPSFSQFGLAGNGGNVTINGGGISKTITIGTLTVPGVPSLSGSINTSAQSSINSLNAGNITVTTLGNITTGDLNSTSVGNTGSLLGGDITLTSTNGAIATGFIDSKSKSIGLVGTSGNILVNSLGNITTGNLTANNANVNISSTNGAIATSDIDTSSVNGGGTVNLTAATDIKAGNLDTSSQLSVDSGSAITQKGGDVNLTAGKSVTSGNITTSSFASSQLATTNSSGVLSTVASNNGGNVSIQAGTDVKVNGNISTNSGAFLAGQFASPSNIAGKISITTGSLVNVNGFLFSGGAQKGGDIIINAVGDIAIANQVASGSEAGFTGVDTLLLKGGDVKFTSTAGNITLGVSTLGNSINTSSDVTSTLNATSGNGGDITLTAAGNITTGNLVTSSKATAGTGLTAITGNAGKITINSGLGITTGNITTQSITKGGDVRLTGNQAITTSDITLSGANLAIAGGVITTGNINTTKITSQGGNVNLTASTGGVRVGTINTTGTPKGGSVNINAIGNITATKIDTGNLGANRTEWLAAGDINLASTNGEILIPTLGAVITSGDISIGIRGAGDLNPITANRDGVGLLLDGVGDALSPGCLCEGFGVSGNGIAGGASPDNPSPGNLKITNWSSTPTTVSTTTVISSLPNLKINQSYAPSAETTALFRNQVTITNTGTSTINDVRYNRTQDWDIPPTEFREFVTVQGRERAANVIYSSNDGFGDVNPLATNTAITPSTLNRDFVNNGPLDQGSAFTFGFGNLSGGNKQVFNIFYGGARSLSNAGAALNAVGAEVYSLGLSSGVNAAGVGNQITGSPATFIFAFSGVGGVPTPLPNPNPPPVPKPPIPPIPPVPKPPIPPTPPFSSRPPINETPPTLPTISLFTRDLVETASAEILQDLEKATGKKPAIITVQFNPPSDRLVLILSTSKGKIIKSVPVTRKQVIDQADNLSLEVATVPIGRNNPDDYLKPAQNLYKWLVAPFDAELEKQEIDTVLFEMPEGMRDRPVAAFHDGKKFMVEKYSLGLIPNLNLVDTRYRNLRQVQALVMGASVFNNPSLKPLPAVPLEVKVIGESWNGASFLNQNFSLENLTNQRNQTPFGIIHLATHAEFIPGGDSYIQLWGDEKLKPEQIRNLGWRDVELLVLSACKTATGDQVDQLGFAGLAYQSGVKSILASLWQVSDEGTLSLMSEFYKQMSRPEVTIKAEGLRQAQLAMLNKEITLKDGTIRSVRGTPIILPSGTLSINRDLSHPFYWAGFALVGSPW